MYHQAREFKRKIRSSLLIVTTGLLALFLLAPASAKPPIGSWSTPVQISSNRCDAGELWQDNVYAYGPDNLSTSYDNGASWNPEIAFTGRIDVVDYVLHRVNGSGSGSLLYSRSTDNGSSWTDPLLVMTNAGNDRFYDIVMVESVLVVFGWSSDGIEVSRSIDGGATWSPQQLADREVTMDDPRQNDIVYFGGKLYIIYSNYTVLPYPYDSEVVIIESSDLGETWDGRRAIGSGSCPQMRTDGNSLYVTYWGVVGLEEGLCFAKSQDGDSWTPGVVVAHPAQYTDPSSHHSLAVLDGNIFIAYMLWEPVGPDNYYWVHVNYSADGGTTWDDLGDVTGGDGGEMYPYLMLTQTTLHMTWVDNMGTGGWGGVTFYRSLTLNDPIPEFSTVLLPVTCTVLLVAGLLLARKR